ncbi:acyl-CoA dehydrogenase family protein [Sporichthya brevicatena]|uniref:Acyl-CoA dehydrogenase family protein n=1 Tax=Sporichthya brevicatena TaxID=171442 RepID=A0ABN1GNN7_9ACTN
MSRRGRSGLAGEVLASDEDESVTDIRQAAREWIEGAFVGEFEALRGRGGPTDLDSWDLSVRWEQAVAQAGWSCIDWPPAYGGRGATINELFAFREECYRAGVPDRVGFVAEDLLAPTMMRFGTAAQCERFLPGIRARTEFWCQGYSEPEAGSDLANISTRARLVGGRWQIDGQKTWTSLAEKADWCFALCRTQPGSQRHQGLSYLLIPMRQPGITVRPIRQLTGTAEFAEVFFDGAVTDEHNVVGPVDEGWRVAMSTLGHERDWFLSRYPRFERDFELVREVVRSAPAGAESGRPARLAALFSELLAFRAVGLTTLDLARAGEGPGALTAITKAYSSRWHERLGDLAMDALGSRALSAHPEGTVEEALQRIFLYSRGETIFAGTTEIQLDLIAKRYLGLSGGRS